MKFIYPQDYTEDDFKNRLSGTELMDRWEVSMAKIQSIEIQAFIEKSVT